MNVYFNLGSPYQNGYYAADGVTFKQVAKGGLKALPWILRIAKLGMSLTGLGNYDNPTIATLQTSSF